MIHITTDTLETMYELLRTTKPFRAWKLPPGDEVDFHVTNAERYQGLYSFENGRHCIRLSYRYFKTLRPVAEIMAHEMCHLRERLLGVRADIMHGAVFHKLADQVCRIHGFDRGQF